MSENKESLETQRKMLLAIQNLNEQIVQARKRGADSEVTQLKQQVRSLLLQQTKSQMEKKITKQSTISSTTSSPTAPIENKESKNTSTDTRSLMEQLQEVNLLIVEARRQGDDSTMQRLQVKAKEIMQQATQQRA